MLLGDRSGCEVLLIDDDPLAVQLVEGALESTDFKVSFATSAETGLDAVAQRRPPLVLLDLMMPNVTGLELLERIHAIDSSIDVILLTGHYSTESAVEAIQKGAFDYLTKPIPVAKLKEKLLKWAEDARLRWLEQSVDAELLDTFRFHGIVGKSPSMQEVFSRIRRIAPHFQTALVTGETGTGKELVAKALHEESPRAAGPFITCNCAALAETLFESELFGYVRGAFTGAVADKLGFVEAARGGTLFLDEIAEIPLTVQAKLLRLIQQREIQRVGSTTPRVADVRIVAATNHNLKELTQSGKFREDLYYRLAMVDIKLPRLADRKEDLALLQKHFLQLYSERYGRDLMGLTRRARAALSAYSWPGNVRELENVLSYCCMITEADSIDWRDLPEHIRNTQSSERDPADRLISMDEMERNYALQVLASTSGNRVRAAEILGISRATLYRLTGGPAKRKTAAAKADGPEES